MNGLTVKPRTFLIGILILAAILRFYQLGTESLWLDEAITVNMFCRQPLWDVFMRGTQGLFFIALTSATCSIAGCSEFVLRFFPALFGIGVVYAGYLLAKKLSDERTALFAALLMAVNPFIIAYSQEARPYSLFLLTAILSVYFVIRLAESGRTADAVGYALTASLALYSHPFAAFLLPTHAVAWALYFPWKDQQERGKSFRKTAVAGVIAFVLFSPQFLRYAFLFLKKAGGGGVADWIWYSTTSDLLFTFKQFLGGYWISRYTALLVLPAFIVFLFRCRDKKVILIPVVWFLLSVILPWAISIKIAPIYVLRYAIPGVAALILLIALSLMSLPALPRYLLAGALLLMTVMPLKRYYTLDDKEPWRLTVQELKARVKPNDLLVVEPYWTNTPLTYYFKDRFPSPVLFADPKVDPRPMLKDAGRIWLVMSYPTSDGKREATLLDALSETHLPDSVISMNEKIRPNPGSNHITPINIIGYQRKDRP